MSEAVSHLEGLTMLELLAVTIDMTNSQDSRVPEVWKVLKEKGIHDNEPLAWR